MTHDPNDPGKKTDPATDPAPVKEPEKDPAAEPAKEPAAAAAGGTNSRLAAGGIPGWWAGHYEKQKRRGLPLAVPLFYSSKNPISDSMPDSFSICSSLPEHFSSAARALSFKALLPVKSSYSFS